MMPLSKDEVHDRIGWRRIVPQRPQVEAARKRRMMSLSPSLITFDCLLIGISNNVSVLPINTTLSVTIDDVITITVHVHYRAISQRNGLYICTLLLLKIDYVLIGSKLYFACMLRSVLTTLLTLLFYKY